MKAYWHTRPPTHAPFTHIHTRMQEHMQEQYTRGVNEIRVYSLTHAHNLSLSLKKTHTHTHTHTQCYTHVYQRTGGVDKIQVYVHCRAQFQHNITAHSREDETRNGHQNTNRNPRWASQVSFHTAHLKRDINFHLREFCFVFR